MYIKRLENNVAGLMVELHHENRDRTRICKPQYEDRLEMDSNIELAILFDL